MKLINDWCTSDSVEPRYLKETTIPWFTLFPKMGFSQKNHGDIHIAHDMKRIPLLNSSVTNIGSRVLFRSVSMGSKLLLVICL
jgi:hypothetical protein